MFDQIMMDEALPAVDTRSTQPRLAYSAARMGSDQILVAVGCFWPEHRDEHGRAGLSFWHGILCDVSEVNHPQLLEIAGILMGLVGKYETQYEDIGKNIADLAVEKRTDDDWRAAVSQLISNTPSNFNSAEDDSIRTLGRNLALVPAQANIRGSQHERLTIPCLLSLLAYREGVERIAGGMLAREGQGRLNHISVSENVPGYQPVNLADLLVVEPEPVVRPTPTPPPSILLKVLASLTVAILVVILIWVWPCPPWSDCPAQVTGLGVKATSNGQLDLSRISNSGKDKVERYKVYRSPSASPDAPIADLTKNTYLDKSVEPGTTYFYRVAAVNSSGTGEKSVEVEGTTLPAK